MNTGRKPPRFKPSSSENGTPEVGDCRQELVFIGIGMDEIAIYDSLHECLLTDAELSTGIEAWMRFQDPFPPWNLSVDEALSARS